MSYKELAQELTDYLAKDKEHEIGLKSIELSQGENAVLGYLIRIKNGASINEIGTYIRVGSGRISDTIKTLVKKEYVVKEVNNKDKRISNIFITKKGKEHILLKHNEALNCLSNSLKCLSEKEAKEFVRLVKKMILKGA